jgi:tetratricopeptide (TPR) repeat protein
MHNLAAVHLDTGNEEESIKLFKMALSFRENQPEPDQTLIASTIHHLGQAYQNNGQLERAAECFERGLQIERDGGKDTIVTRELLNLIANIKMMLASVDEMMESFVEASRLQKPGEKADFMDFLLVTGHNFFDLSRLHPKCAPTA